MKGTPVSLKRIFETSVTNEFEFNGTIYKPGGKIGLYLKADAFGSDFIYLSEIEPVEVYREKLRRKVEHNREDKSLPKEGLEYLLQEVIENAKENGIPKITFESQIFIQHRGGEPWPNRFQKEIYAFLNIGFKPLQDEELSRYLKKRGKKPKEFVLIELKKDGSGESIQFSSSYRRMNGYVPGVLGIMMHNIVLAYKIGK